MMVQIKTAKAVASELKEVAREQVATVSVNLARGSINALIDTLRTMSPDTKEVIIKDTEGEIPDLSFKRHVNKDGKEGKEETVGGFVQSDCVVEESAHIGPNAFVYGGAKLIGKVRLLDTSFVGKGAEIEGVDVSVVIKKGARIVGDIWLKGIDGESITISGNGALVGMKPRTIADILEGGF